MRDGADSVHARLAQRAGPPELAIEGVAVREEPLRDGLADDHDALWLAGAIVLGELAAGDDRDAERREEAWPDARAAVRTGCLPRRPECSPRR